MLDLTAGSETEDDLELSHNNSAVLDLTEVDSPDFNAISSPDEEIGEIVSDSEDEEEEGVDNQTSKLEELKSTISSSNGVGGESLNNATILLQSTSNDADDAMGLSLEQPEASTSNSPNLTQDLSKQSDTSAYLSALSRRQSLFLPSPISSSAKSYSIESIFTIPQSTHTHAIALPPCSSHLYAGGADGIIRRYALHPSLNNTASDLAVPNNLTIKPGTTLATNDSKLPVLIGCYENEEPGTWCDGDLVGGSVSESEGLRKVNWGPKSYALRESPVYSLAIHTEELWGLSGTGKGSINLFTIRHDEGQIRHVFKSFDNLVSQGHHSKSPVSALTLAYDQHSFLSGGWDTRILDWDLDTGIATSDYVGHTGQISSISYRPLSSDTSFTNPSTQSQNEDVEMDLDDVKLSNSSNPPLTIITTLSTSASTTPLPSSTPLDRNALSTDQIHPALTSPISSPDSSTGVAAALVQPSTTVNPSSASALIPNVILTAGVLTSPKSEEVAGGEEEDADGSEADADGDDDDDDDDLMNGTTVDSNNGAAALPSMPTSVNSVTTTNGLATPLPVLPLKKKAQVIDSIPIIGAAGSKLPTLSSSDVFMSTSIDGQVLIWDKRIRNGGGNGGVRRFGKTKNDSWCASATWSVSGQEIYVGRRDALVEIYDIRHSTASNPVIQTLRMASSSGPVTAIAALPSGKHIITGSSDIIRLWDSELAKELEGSGKKRLAYKIVVGHQGATGPALPKCVISQLYVDPKTQFLISSSGSRGWEGNSTENLIVHEIKSFY